MLDDQQPAQIHTQVLKNGRLFLSAPLGYRLAGVKNRFDEYCHNYETKTEAEAQELIAKGLLPCTSDPCDRCGHKPHRVVKPVSSRPSTTNTKTRSTQVETSAPGRSSEQLIEELVDRVLFHPLFRQRVNEVLRKHGLLPGIADEPVVVAGRPVLRQPGLPSGTTLELEELGIYIPISQACRECNIAESELREAIAGKRLRSRDGVSGTEVEKDTLRMFLEAREMRKLDETKSAKGARPEERIGLHVVQPSRKTRETTDGAPKARGTDQVGVQLPSRPRPDGAVTAAEAAYLLNVKAVSVPAYVSSGLLTRAIPGYVTLASVLKRCARNGIELKPFPQSITPEPLAAEVAPSPSETPQPTSSPSITEEVPAGAITMEEAAERYGYAVPALNALIGYGRIAQPCPGYLMPAEIERYIESRKANR